MAYEYTLDKILNPEDLKRIEDAEAIFKNTGIAYAGMAKKMAGGIKFNPSDLEAMDKKQKEYIEQLKQLYETQNKLSEQQKECGKVRQEVAEQIRKNTDAIKAEAEANRLNKAAELDMAKAKTEQLKQEKLLNQTKKQTKVTIEEGVAALKMEVKTLRDAEEQNRLLRAAKKDIDLTTKEGRDTMLKFNTAIDKNTELIKKNSDSLVKSKMNVGRYKEDIKSATSEILKGNISLKNMGDLAKSTGGYLKSSMGAGLSEVRIGVGSMIKGMIGAQAIIGLFQKTIGLFKSGVRTIVDFEAANSRLAAILGTTSKNMQDLTSDARKLGAATKYTAAEATNLQIELAKLGFSRKEILESTEYILRFAQATGADLPEAAALAGASLRMFGANTRETERYVSAMAVATVKSALSFGYLQTAMPIVGPVAKAFNFQIEDTLALLGKLADAGFDASMAATATRNILLNLADGQGKLAKELGAPVKDLPDLVYGLKKLRDQGIDLNSTLELTDKRSVAAFNSFLTAADGIIPLREQITGVTKELSDMANTMGDNVEGATKALSSAWDEFALSFSKTTGPMKSFLNWMAEKIRGIAESMKDFDQRTVAAGMDGKSLGEKASSTFEIKARIMYNKEYKRLLDAGDSAEQASLKAISTVSSKKIQVREDELKKLELLKQKALNIGKKSDEAKGLSWSKFLFGSDRESEKGLEKGEKAAQKEYMLYQYEISKKEANNTGIDNFLSTKKESKAMDVYTPIISDKEKAALEKANKERLKIRETYQQSELDLMDEGLEKEIAKISLSYTKKMSAVSGMSKDEINTRKNIAEEMKRAIEDKTISYNMSREKTDIANKLEVVKNGSEEELGLKIKQLNLMRETEIDESEKTGQDVFAIDAKYKAKELDLIEKFANDKIKKIQESYAVQSIFQNQSLQNDLKVAADSYTNGEISKEEYEKRKLNIQQDYAIKSARLAIDSIKSQLDTKDLSLEDRMSLENKLAEAEIALSNLVTDAKIANTEREAEARKKNFKDWEEGLAMVGEALNAFADLGSAIYERKIEEVEGEQEKNQEAGEAEQERIDKLAENGVITSEEAEARKRAAAAKTAEKDKELAKKKADLQTKQAKMDKANAIVQSIINTAIAVMKVWGQTGIGGFALAPVVAALGAIQLATIIAQPIPKYVKGTDNHPGGLAVVGDGGKQEMIVSNGKSWITPSVPTLVDIPKGAVVLPDVMNMDSIRHMRSDLAMLANESAKKGNPITVNVNNDYRKIEGGIDRLNSSFNAMAKYQRKAAVQADLRNISSRL